MKICFFVLSCFFVFSYSAKSQTTAAESLNHWDSFDVFTYQAPEFFTKSELPWKV